MMVSESALPRATSRTSTRVVAVYATFVTVFFLAQFQWHEAPLFRDVLTTARVHPLIHAGKLLPQVLGAIWAGQCARHYGEGTAARRSWWMMSAWLACWGAGQLVLATYVVVIHTPPPVPSIADALFFLGYAFVIVALFGFVSAYRASGFATGGGVRESAVITAVLCAVFAVVGAQVLLPIWVAPTPLSERLVNVGYPAVDLVTLIPAAIVLAITLRFRGGQVWRVWAALLAGIGFATGGDILFADTSPGNALALGPLADLTFTLGYTLCAYGARLQRELVSAD
jgi:hypothetical protein